ncbi:unnamed protein product [Ectocarpus sp. CCAP 1310/34]|nr:unnamed protein product [Ectocarpus sp. CCAP 1310/34]
MCGGPEDAVALGFGGTCEVITNDLSLRVSPGSYLDASLLSFPGDFLKAHSGKQPKVTGSSRALRTRVLWGLSRRLWR